MPKQKTAPFMEWLETRVDRWNLRERVEAEFQKLMIEQRLAALREKRGLTQTQLARRLGVSQAMVAKLESGRSRNITLETLIKTALALGVEPRIEFRPLRPGRAVRRGNTLRKPR
jgi:HTH-type transcriptional regulator / antitoxin HipB